MVLKFKKPENDLKKVMIYGLDGTGKSTFAANYCSEYNLNPVVIDIDDTNRTVLYTQGRVLDVNMKTDLLTFQNVKKTIEEIKNTDFDTIIIDGVTSLLEMLTSDARGLAKYSDRASRFNKILQALLDSRKNIIFIGQIDMEVIFTEDFQSPKAVIKVNSMVNEKYLCFVDEKGNYAHEVKKFRTLSDVPETTQPEHNSSNLGYKPQKSGPQSAKVMNETATKQVADEFVTAAEVGEPDPADDPIKSQCYMVKDMLEAEGKPVTKHSMKVKVVQLAKAEGLPVDNKRALLAYIAEHCPEEL